jgi:ketosteroid isomerase-like protein
MKKILTILSLLFGQFVFAQNKDVTAIKSILENQTVSWNKGDLNSFMSGYLHSDSLVFIGKSGPTYGYENTLANYKKGYPDTSHMGKLHFDIVSIKPLNSNHYFVIGKWFLTRTVGNVNGVFTLVLRKTKEGWKIISDHSS